MSEERSGPANHFHPGNLLADHYGVVNPPPVAPPSDILSCRSHAPCRRGSERVIELGRAARDYTAT
jgi:hypothetical protein